MATSASVPITIPLSTITTPFEVTHPLFSELRAKSLELGMTLDQIDTQIDLLNQSPLAVALLHTYEEETRVNDETRPLAYDPDTDRTWLGEELAWRTISIHDLSDLAGILAHQLGQFADPVLHLGDTNGFSEILNAETQEARASAVSFAIREQIMDDLYGLALAA
ncbi:MAG: hypothetical protein ACOY3Z_01380 [Thermodesulfobacteriota bacterium]